MSSKVSVVIPAHNEEKHIQNLIERLLGLKYLDEIICVNDGSTDNTFSILSRTKGIRLINLEKNRGKGFALATGIREAQGEIILMIDADIIGLNDALIKSLIEPIQKGECDVVFAYPNLYFLDKITIPLTGERAYFKKDLLPHLNNISKHSLGSLEFYLNFVFKDKKIKIVPFPNGVRHPFKEEKMTQMQAKKAALKAIMDTFFMILCHKNPFYYFFRAYLYPYYIKEKSIKKLLTDRSR